MIAIYFAIGLGFYIGLALNNTSSFKNADIKSVIRGIVLGIPLWPICIVVKLLQINEDNK